MLKFSEVFSPMTKFIWFIWGQSEQVQCDAFLFSFQEDTRIMKLMKLSLMPLMRRQVIWNDPCARENLDISGKLTSQSSYVSSHSDIIFSEGYNLHMAWGSGSVRGCYWDQRWECLECSHVRVHLGPRKHLFHNLSDHDYLWAVSIQNIHRKGNVWFVSRVINIVPHREFLIFYEHLKVWFRSVSVLWGWCPCMQVWRRGEMYQTINHQYLDHRSF